MLIANLRELALDDLLAQPIQDLPQAQLYATVCQYRLRRERVQDELRHYGGILLDAPPHQLPAAMVNQYLALKRGGRLSVQAFHGRFLIRHARESRYPVFSSSNRIPAYAGMAGS